MKKLKNNPIFSHIIIAFTYIVAIISCYFLYQVLPISNLLLMFLVLDIIATIIVFIFSIIFNNASIYDPYWSVAPMVMAPLFAYLTSGINPYEIIIIVLIEIWGIRLTLNCATRFKNLNQMDWRYQNYKQRFPKFWLLISFSGIHLMPTLVVFIAMLPAFSYMNTFDQINVEPNGTLVISIIVALIAIIVEMIADLQMDKFKKNPENKGKIIELGLWKISRHPNYFGEILFWFSMFLFSLSVNDSLWVLMFSPLIIFLLFTLITIPMMEKRQLSNKEGYKEYQLRTNMLLPILKPTEEEIERKREKQKNKVN